jgi:hypothetical protein
MKSIIKLLKNWFSKDIQTNELILPNFDIGEQVISLFDKSSHDIEKGKCYTIKGIVDVDKTTRLIYCENSLHWKRAEWFINYNQKSDWF